LHASASLVKKHEECLNYLEYDAWYQSCPMLYDFVNEVYAEDLKAFNYKMQYGE
jgi:hypothetical protein